MACRTNRKYFALLSQKDLEVVKNRWITNDKVIEKLGDNLESLDKGRNMVDCLVIKQDLPETDYR